MVRIKICGLTRREDAIAAEAAGAAFGGVILAPGSPRTIDPDRVSALFEDSALLRCGVFVNERADSILSLVDRLTLSVVQLHGEETPELAGQLRNAGIVVWKAVRPRSADEFVAAAAEFEGAVDGLLLDGWSAAARGGTGSRFPWREIAAERGRLPPETILIAAGGLNAANVGEAVSLLSPDVVDVSSGVESAPGIKDGRQVREFAEAALSATAEKGAV